MRPFNYILLLTLTVTAAAKADVTATINADVLARFDGTDVTDSSTLLGDSIVAFSSANNSLTDTNQNWNYDAATLTLTGTGTTEAEKTVSAKPGGNHRGTTSLVFNFEIDSDVDYALSGTFGFSNAINGTDDSITYLLSGPGGTIVSGSATSTDSLNPDSFSHSGTLLNSSGTGTTLYTLTMASVLDETLNNAAAVTATWNLTSFQLTTSAPEPSSFALVLSAGIFTCVRRRKRSRRLPVCPVL